VTPSPVASPVPGLPELPARRRLYLMRHGSVDYFTADGTPLPPHTVPLNATGQAQADAAGALLGAAGARFDRVLTSGLRRTVETAQRVLAAAGQAEPPGGLCTDERLQEIRPGRLEDLPRAQLKDAFTAVFSATADIESQRFLGGETIGQMLDRSLPAFDELLADPAWRCALVVLHGGINRGLLGHVMTGQRLMLGRLEQSPACINVLDVGAPGHTVVRAVNLAPTQWLHERERYTTMEKLLLQYLRGGDVPL